MELLIWAGGRWRRVCPASGRVTGWRRRARFLCNRKNALRELSLNALRSVVKGTPLQKQRVRDTKLQPPAATVGKPCYRNEQKTQKDASVQTDNESLRDTVDRPMQNSYQHVRNKPSSQDNNEKENIKTQPNNVNCKTTEKCCIEQPNSSEDQALPTAKTITSKTQNSGRTESQNINKQQLGTLSNDSKASSEEDLYKEIIIDEQDVILLRNYIETHDTNVDLYRFDIDDNYKTYVFFKINPLVRVERCPKIAQMISDRDAHITVHFARQLGLRSVDDSDNFNKIEHKRNKNRATKIATNTQNHSEDTDSNKESRKSKKESKENNKENKILLIKDNNTDRDSDVQVLRRNKRRNITDMTNEDTDAEDCSTNKKPSAKEARTIDSDGQEKENVTSKQKNKKAKKDASQTLKTKNFVYNLTKSNKHNTNSSGKDITQKELLQNDSKHTQSKGEENNELNYSNEENHQPKHIKSKAYLRSIAKPKRSSVRPGREYSMLEDQAIVAWLSASTARERAVNGNRIWRELQGTYAKLTGQERSWHSLRNRYLRYILPALGALALPAPQAQRLRAHATLGELKSRKQSRRNSVLRLPVVQSAFSRVRRPVAPETPDIPVSKTPIIDDSSSSESSEAPTTSRRVLRSSTQSPGHTHTNRRLTRSQNTQHANHTQSPNKALSNHTQSKSSAEINSGGTRSPVKARELRSTSPRSSPSYAELTRRLGLRHRSTPLNTPEPAVANHKRRLYNPQRHLSSGTSNT